MTTRRNLAIELVISAHTCTISPCLNSQQKQIQIRTILRIILIRVSVSHRICFQTFADEILRIAEIMGLRNEKPQ